MTRQGGGGAAQVDSLKTRVFLASPLRLAARCALGTRASMIRQRVKRGRRIQIYMKSIYAVAWLRACADFIGYVAMPLDEPCGRCARAVAFLL